MSPHSTWAAVVAAFFLGQVAIVSGLIVLEHQKMLRVRTRITTEHKTFAHTPPANTSDALAWLLCAVWCAGFSSLGDLLHHTDVYRWALWLSPLTDSALLLLGPTLWFFTCSVTRQPPEPQPSGRSLALHALPAVVVFVMLVVSVVFSGPKALHTATELLERSAAEIFSLTPVALHLLAYLLALQWRIHTTRDRLVDQVSNLTDKRLAWLSLSAWLLKALLALWVVSWTWDRAVSDLLTNLLLALWLAVVGWFGIQQHNVFSSEMRSKSEVGSPCVDGGISSIHGSGQLSSIDTLTQTATTHRSLPGKYAKAGLGADQLQAIADRLYAVMTKDKLYLDHQLNLAELAKSVGCSPHQLSQVLSTHLGESFYDHVNAWRVKAVQATLLRPQSAGRTLLELAFECGFGSKSAFNEAFKRVSGMSPSAYRKGLPATVRSAAASGTTGQVRPNGSRRENP